MKNNFNLQSDRGARAMPPALTSIGVGFLCLLLIISCYLPTSFIHAQEIVNENGFAARVDGKVITLAELNLEVQRQISSARGQITESQIEYEKALLRPLVLRILVERQLLIQKAIHEEIHLPPKAIDNFLQNRVEVLSKAEGTRYSVDDYLALWQKQFGESEVQLRKRLSEELRIDELRRRTLRSTRNISPRKLRAYYKEHADEFRSDSRISFRQLLVADDDPDSNRMLGEIDRALEAEEEFESLVKKWSMGPRKDIGGLYSLTEKDLDSRFPPVPEMVKKLKPGEYSGWFMCRGYAHNIKLIEISPGILLDFSRAQDQIRSILTRELEEKKRKEFEQSLWKDAVIEVFIPGIELPLL
ncbi:MAG: hypothetical protein HN598_09455 [Planctomycetes bacterium]|jgi:hypothetical protein|nr:hypothetical protein [Planctomycetota bacterium]